MRDNLVRRETLLVGPLMYAVVLELGNEETDTQCRVRTRCTGLWGNRAKTQENGDAANIPSVWKQIAVNIPEQGNPGAEMMIQWSYIVPGNK